nr:alpha/beta hydrolase [uncultured Friedmanniella sp.]
MTAQLTAGRLDVPGASLYWETRGSGPLTLVIGQPMTSEPFGPLAELLADRRTVVTYDPRGLGRSTVQDPSQDVSPEIVADDLARLVETLGAGPADVLGSSGGAVAGLALAARHPAQVRTLVAHEPPVTELLPDAGHLRAVVDSIEDAYRREGSAAAWALFVSLVMHNGPLTEPRVPPVAWPPPGQDPTQADATSQEAAEPSAKQQADDELFFLHALKPFTRYRPDLDGLRSGSPRVVIAAGETSRQEVAVRATRVLAEQLGMAPTLFPGHHGGFMDDPVAFADVLRRVLDGAAG